MNPEEPRVAVVILNWNGLDDTVECLESLKAMTYANYRVIVIDNGSVADEAGSLRERFGSYVHVIENDRNYGFAEGCNIGIRHARETSSPDYVLLLNNDTSVDPGFLSELVSVAESDRTIGIVGAKVFFHHDPRRIQSAGARANMWTGQVSLIGWGEIDTGQFGETRDVQWVGGCAMLIRASAIEDIGLFDADFFAYFEETDLCARCWRAGYRVLCAPTAQLWHKRKIAVDRMDEFRVYYVTRNRFLFMRRNASRLQLSFFLLQSLLRNSLATPLTLLIRQRQPRLLPTYCKATSDGVRIALTGTGGGENRSLSDRARASAPPGEGRNGGDDATQ